MSRLSIMLATAAILVSATAASAEEHDGQQETSAVAAAKVPLDAAVAIAQKHAQGRALEADYEKQKNGTWAYEVEVAAGAKIVEVKVDAESGAVLSAGDQKEDGKGDEKED